MMIQRIGLLLLVCHWGLVDAYVNVKHALPDFRKLEYLKQITGEICEKPTGELSDAMIANSHRIMEGWSTTNSKISTKENAMAIENIVKRLVDEAEAGNPNANPTTKDYNCMLESWAKSGCGVYAAERCEEILTQMQSEYESGNSQLQIRPNLSSFKIVLQAWKHAGGKDLSSFRAQKILDWMSFLYSEGKNDLAQPDQMCFDTVLQSWSRNNHPQAPVYAEKLLAKMETMKLESTAIVPLVQPRTLSFNAVLGAWSKAPLEPSTLESPSAFDSEPFSRPWQRACDILQFMEKLYYCEGNSMVEPDKVSYSLVLRTLARDKTDSNTASKADTILRFVERQYKQGELSWLPDTLLFNTAMGCWSHSHLKGSYRKARGILDRQIHLYKSVASDDCRPDVYGFTTVLSSCSVENGDEEEQAKAFNVARSTYQQLVSNQEEYGTPNHVTYGTMLKCIANLMPPDHPQRKKWTKKVFSQAIANGCVGGMVLRRLQEASSSPKEYKALLRGHTPKKLPPSWTSNVNERVLNHRRKSSGKRAEV